MPVKLHPSVTVPVLYAETSSVYKSLNYADVYDEQRDARTCTSDAPVVAHPPCRLWSRLRAFSTAPAEERDLALHALAMVRRNGGVLEHPECSTLWSHASLPAPGTYDEWGGWTMPIDQGPFGHPARKRTLLYIVGLSPCDLPPFPVWGYAATTVSRQHSSHRNRTPLAFAMFLLDIASRIAISRSRA